MNTVEFILYTILLAYWGGYVFYTMRQVDHFVISNTAIGYIKKGKFVDLAVINHKFLKGMIVLPNEWIVNLYRDNLYTIYNNKGELISNCFVEKGVYQYFFTHYFFNHYRLKRLINKTYVEKFGDNVVEFKDGKMVVLKSV